MFDESHRGHLRFWFSEFDGVVELGVLVVAVEEVVVVVTLVVEGGHGEEEGMREQGDGRTPLPPDPLVEVFLSPAMRVAPPNSSWIIIFISEDDLQQSKNNEKQKEGGGESFCVSGEKRKKVGLHSLC